MATKTRYYVNKNGSISTLTGELLTSGMEVRIGEHVKNQAAMDDKVRSRYVVARQVDVAEITDEMPGVDKTTLMPHEVDLTGKDGRTEDTRKGIKGGTMPGVDALANRAKRQTDKAQIQGKWAIDPATLSDKPIEQLNAMILERDPSITPFADTNEAVAQLSADYKGK